jgi:hypothetical protein
MFGVEEWLLCRWVNQIFEEIIDSRQFAQLLTQLKSYHPPLWFCKFKENIKIYSKPIEFWDSRKEYYTVE